MGLNISNPTGLDFKAAQFDQVRGKPRTGSKCEDLKSSAVQIGGFGGSHTNNSLLKVK